ncbi:MAG: hypothetical protein PHI19_00520 [Clostridia bacterium]|nr:hypothetical protein [Clostridia bacterium]
MSFNGSDQSKNDSILLLSSVIPRLMTLSPVPKRKSVQTVAPFDGSVVGLKRFSLRSRYNFP